MMKLKKLDSSLFPLVLFFLVLFLYGGCGSGGSGNQEENTCYLPDSSNPCFDPNTGGSTSTIIDQTVEDVISDLENMPGFQRSLSITTIKEELAFIFPGTDPDCPYEQSELVIKTVNDWDEFIKSCFFSPLDLPNVNFQNEMVLVSTQEFARFGTSIKAAFEINGKVVVIIEDEISFVPTPAPAFPISIVSVPRAELPVDYIRVKKDITPTIPTPCLDASEDPNILENNMECPTDALVQMCNTFKCNNLEFFFLPIECLASSCFDLSCEVYELDNTFEILGTGDFNIETVAGNTMTGTVTIDFLDGGMENVSYECSPFIN